MKTGKLLAGLVLAGVAGGAQAGSFMDAWNDVAAPGNAVYTFNDLSGAKFFDSGAVAGQVDEGDVIFGTFVLDEVLGAGSSDLVDISGAYALQVTSISGNNVTFGSVTNAGLVGAKNSVLAGFDAAIFEGGLSTDANDNPPMDAFDETGAVTAWTDGVRLMGLDLVNYTAEFLSLDIATLLSNNPLFDDVEFTNNEFVVADADASVLNNVPNIIGSSLLASGTINANSGQYFTDTATFRIAATVVPAPAAAGAGLLGLVGLVGRRRRQA